MTTTHPVVDDTGRRPAHEALAGNTALLLTLSFVAGMVDVTSFVLLHGVFAAHITGNIVVLAAAVATHRAVELTSVMAVVVFVAVTAALTVTVDRSARLPYQWARAFLGVQFLLLAAVATAAVLLHAAGRDGSGADLTLAVLAVAAMAAQNALLHLTFRYSPSTAVMTGNTVAGTVALVGIGLDRMRRRASLPPRRDAVADRTAWQHSWPTLAGFVAGCLLGAAASEALEWWAWTMPALVAAALLIVLGSHGLPVALQRQE